LAQSPDDPLSHLYVGMALAEEHRCAEAVPHLQRASGRSGAPMAGQSDGRAEILFYLGRCQLSLDQPEDAKSTLAEALAIAERQKADEGTLMSLHYQLGLALRRTGAENEATAHFQEAERRSAVR